jgi:HEAT repeat protein
MSDEEKIALLLSKLNDDSSMMDINEVKASREAAASLTGLGSRVVQHLLQILLDPDSGANRVAATILGNIGEASVVPDLLNACTHSNALIRQAAINALGSLKAKKAVSMLNDMMNSDPSPDVRHSIAEALGSIRDPSSMRYLSDALQAKQHRWFYSIAAGSLSSYGDVALPHIIDAMRNPDLNSDAREALVMMLEYHGPSALDDLLTILDDPSSPVIAKCNALTLVGRIDDPASVATIEDALNSGEWDLVESAAWALTIMTSDEARDALHRGLRSGNARIQSMIAFEISNWQDNEFEDDLIELLSDQRVILDEPHFRKTRVSDAAYQALESLDTDKARDALQEWRKKSAQ